MYTKIYITCALRIEMSIINIDFCNRLGKLVGLKGSIITTPTLEGMYCLPTKSV